MFTGPKLSPDGAGGGVATLAGLNPRNSTADLAELVGVDSGATRSAKADFVRGRELANDEQRALGKRMLFALVGDEALHAQASQEQFVKGEACLRDVISKLRSDADDHRAYTNYVRGCGSANTPWDPDKFREATLGRANDLEKLIDHHRKYPPEILRDRNDLASDGRKLYCFSPMSNQGGSSILSSSTSSITHPADLVNSLARSVLSVIDARQRLGHPLDLKDSPQYQALLGISEAAKQHSIDLQAPDMRTSGEAFMRTTLTQIEEAVRRLLGNTRGKH
jgi:hypothetical protein